MAKIAPKRGVTLERPTDARPNPWPACDACGKRARYVVRHTRLVTFACGTTAEIKSFAELYCDACVEAL